MSIEELSKQIAELSKERSIIQMSFDMVLASFADEADEKKTEPEEQAVNAENLRKWRDERLDELAKSLQKLTLRKEKLEKELKEHKIDEAIGEWLAKPSEEEKDKSEPVPTKPLPIGQFVHCPKCGAGNTALCTCSGPVDTRPRYDPATHTLLIPDGMVHPITHPGCRPGTSSERPPTPTPTRQSRIQQRRGAVVSI